MTEVFGLPLTAEQIRYICQNSPERVINTAININLDLDASNQHEDGHVNLEDLEAIKLLVTQMWNQFRNEIYVRKLR